MQAVGTCPTVALFDFINGSFPDSPQPVDGYIMRPHYSEGPQYCCPVLDVLGAETVGVEHVPLKPTDERLPIEQLISKYPRQETRFFYKEPPPRYKGPSGEEVKLDALEPHPKLRSVTFRTFLPLNFEKANGEEMYMQIKFECDHWTTATRIHVVMSSLFKLSIDKNIQEGPILSLKTQDTEQFLDMMQFVTHNISIEGPVENALKCTLSEALFASDDKKYEPLAEDIHDVVC
jgi:hypothetical protein